MVYPPLGGLAVCRDHVHLRSGSWVLVCLYLLAHNLPPLPKHEVISSLTVSLYSAAGGNICVGVRTVAKGPRSQAISDCPVKK